MPVLNMFGVPLRHCINGITKDDKVNIDSIPSLDERITDLENTPFSEWVEVDVSTYNKANSLVNDLFTFDGDHYFTKYDMMIRYRTNLYYVKKGLDIDVPSIEITMTVCHLTSSANDYMITEDEISVKSIFFVSSTDGTVFNYKEDVFSINKTDASMNLSSDTRTMYRNRLSVFVKGYEPISR